MKTLVYDVGNNVQRKTLGIKMPDLPTNPDGTPFIPPEIIERMIRDKSYKKRPEPCLYDYDIPPCIPDELPDSYRKKAPDNDPLKVPRGVIRIELGAANKYHA